MQPYLDKLKEIQKELKSQDNRCTSDPIFLVQEKERIYGMDEDYSDEYVWYDPYNDCEADLEEEQKLNDDSRLYEEIDYDCWQLIPYLDKQMTVQSFFTEKAAQEYIDRNSHRHSGKLSIYVDSLYRNSEMRMIRDFILNL